MLVWVLFTRHVVTVMDLVLFICVVPSIILHEVSHGVVALMFGDDTARRAGRLTLNPLRHIDPFGTILLPAVLALMGGPVIGYAKPVPVNVGRLRNPRNHGLLVSLAGPATNAVLAGAAALLLRGPLLNSPFAMAVQVVYIFGAVNMLLGAFNLLPIPPLDGSALLERLLPKAWWPGYLRFRQYALVVLLAVFFLFGGLGFILTPALRLWGHIA